MSERPIVLFISAWQSVRSFVRPSFVTITQSGDEKKNLIDFFVVTENEKRSQRNLIRQNWLAR
jgi:hypothetical protein